MTKIMLVNHFTDDERWLSAGSDAMALFIAGLCYSDRNLTDGRILKALAPRLCLAVSPDATEAAIDALLTGGWWTEDIDNYWVDRYFDYGLSKAEQEATRAKWARSKQRKRLHDNGNHDLCDPGRCRGALADRSTEDSTPESEGLYPTRPDPTRHDPTLREGSVEGSGRPSAASPPGRDADAPDTVAHLFVDDGSGFYCELCNLPSSHGQHLAAVAS